MMLGRSSWSLTPKMCRAGASGVASGPSSISSTMSVTFSSEYSLGFFTPMSPKVKVKHVAKPYCS